jgi:hypothetical protein
MNAGRLRTATRTAEASPGVVEFVDSHRGNAQHATNSPMIRANDHIAAGWAVVVFVVVKRFMA